MCNKRILDLLTVYLLGVPIVTSINGLSMFVTGITFLGPLYHGVFSLLLIGCGLFSRNVRKSWIAILAAAMCCITLVTVQAALGLSDLALLDLGIQYKWLMPLLLLAVYYRWDYLSESYAQKKLARVFRNLPLIYAALIFLSLGTSILFHFNPTAFDSDSRERYVGYAWAYNPTVNVFLICGYITLVLLRTAAWKRLIYCAAFVLLLSKSALLYFGLIGISFVRPYFRRASARSRVLVVACAVPIVALTTWFGLDQTLRSAGRYDSEISRDSVTLASLPEMLIVGRAAWWVYVLDDATRWPVANIIFGNGTNIDRRRENPLWQVMLGEHYYADLKVDKTTKTLELDILGYFDLYGVCGVVIFGFVFYIYPLFAIKLPYFRLYSLMLTGLSLWSGHLLNNPQASTVLVAAILFLKYHVPGVPRRFAPAVVTPGAPTIQFATGQQMGVSQP